VRPARGRGRVAPAARRAPGTTATRETPWTGPLEVVILPVSDVDRSIAFYRDQVGFELDHDTRTDQMHVVQLTPRGSGCSIVFGDLPSQNQMEPGSMKGPRLVVADAAARAELLGRGVEARESVSFGDQDGSTFSGFSDPDGKTFAAHRRRRPPHPRRGGAARPRLRHLRHHPGQPNHARPQADPDLARQLPQVTECHRITGEDCYFLKLYLRSIEELEPILDTFTPLGRTTTSIVNATPIPPRPLPVTAVEPGTAASTPAEAAARTRQQHERKPPPPERLEPAPPVCQLHYDSTVRPDIEQGPDDRRRCSRTVGGTVASRAVPHAVLIACSAGHSGSHSTGHN
jgi:catechol 2,3-dioxygenase-like lactoylglutathione lyase family enzyme